MRSVLMKERATADNRAYLATVLRTSAKIPLRGTSDTLDILNHGRNVLGTKKILLILLISYRLAEHHIMLVKYGAWRGQNHDEETK